MVQLILYKPLIKSSVNEYVKVNDRKFNFQKFFSHNYKSDVQFLCNKG